MATNSELIVTVKADTSEFADEIRRAMALVTTSHGYVTIEDSVDTQIAIPWWPLIAAGFIGGLTVLLVIVLIAEVLVT